MTKFSKTMCGVLALNFMASFTLKSETVSIQTKDVWIMAKK